MLNFFRKYQKIFFIFITCMVVISFTFFGTFSTFTAREEVPDRKVAIALDGSKVMSKEVEMMNRFLREGDLLNGSLVHHDFLETGLAALLVERYWNDIKADIETRFRKAKHFTPYAHPQVPFLTARVVWEQYCPSMNPLLEELKQTSEEMSPATFSLLLKLYLAQTKLPPQLLKQLLLYQQNQYSWARPDPALNHEDLALFGFHSIEDWFGPKFVSLVSQFLIHASVYAKQQGYQLTKEEARADLLLNVRQGLEQYAQGKAVSLEEAHSYYYQMLQSLGLDENKAISLWKKVMGFRRLFQEGAGGVFLDALSLQQFHTFTRDSAKIALYQLPEALHFSDFRSLMKFQCYLDSISAEKQGDLVLPKTFLTLSQIEKRFPQLVQKQFQLKVAEVKVDQLIQRISLKETWEWELEPGHFSYLQEQFPLLALESSASREERFAALEKLDSKVRFKVDQVARKNILNLHPQWIDEALEKAIPSEQTVSIKPAATLPFAGVEDPLEFAVLLEKEDPSLKRFTKDEETYYRVHVLKKPEGKEVLTFAEAMQDGTLDKLLDQKLEAIYPEIRKRNPTEFALDKSNWKPFEEVKDQVGQHLYHQLFSSFEQKNCFWDFMKKAREECERQNGPKEFGGHQLEKQWSLVKQEIDMKRQQEKDPLLEEAFHLKEGEWSSLLVQKGGELCFFQLLERKQSQDSAVGDIAEAQKPLALEAQRTLMQQLLNLLEEKKLISLSSNETE